MNPTQSGSLQHLRRHSRNVEDLQTGKLVGWKKSWRKFQQFPPGSKNRGHRTRAVAVAAAAAAVAPIAAVAVVAVVAAIAAAIAVVAAAELSSQLKTHAKYRMRLQRFFCSPNCSGKKSLILSELLSQSKCTTKYRFLQKNVPRKH